LEYFQTAQKLNWQQAQWSLYLSWFDFLLHNKPRRSMGKPDALSQRADHGDGSGDNKDITLLQLELFAICALKWKNRTFSEISAAETGLEHRRTQWQPQPKHSKSPPQENISDLPNGGNCKTSCSSGIASMFLRMQTSAARLLSNTMIPTLLDMQAGGKHWNWYPLTTGGCKCPATLASIAKPVTSASEQRHRNDHQWVNSNCFQFQRDIGMWQV
jgi:hypothetical protein